METFRQSLARLRSIKQRVKILYTKDASLMESDTRLAGEYARVFQCQLSESQRSSVRRAGRYWRARWHYQRQRATEETAYIRTYACDS